MFFTRLFCCVAPFLMASASYGQKLYSIDSKDVTLQELSPSGLQMMHDIELTRYRQIQALVDEQLLDSYFKEKAAKAKKTKEEVEVDELRTGDPSDKELKAFYEENKARIPPGYTFDQVKPELKRFLAEKKGVEKRQALLTKIKKSRKFKFLLEEPQAPTIVINSDGFQTKGKAGKVKIVEFADYQCPHCREAADAFEKLMKKYSDRVEFVYIDYPINRSGISRTIAEGAYCAAKQNKYWEFHEKAFKDQASLSKDSPVAMAKEFKLNEADFTKCLNSAEAKTYVSKGKDEGDRVGVSGTPTIFINGKKYTEAHDYETMKKVIEKLL